MPPMLLVLFQVGDAVYAIETAPIVEIVPMVLLRQLAYAAEFVAGVFNYHGEIIPVIELCQLLQGSSCHSRYSTRIIVISDGTQQLGLMAERVTETLNRSEHQATAAPVGNSPYLGEAFMNDQTMIQQINWQPLVAIAHSAATLVGGSSQTNGAERN